MRVCDGDLIHADKHGFLAVPPDDQAELLEAARFMDSNECRTVIAAARSAAGRSSAEVLDSLQQASQAFGSAARARFSKRGEW